MWRPYGDARLARTAVRRTFSTSPPGGCTQGKDVTYHIASHTMPERLTVVTQAVLAMADVGPWLAAVRRWRRSAYVL